ncbi:hypothetical protein [Polaribacter porphyrae]|uniref:Outer membrane protein beta-barrel domain-containing protein n=1 Tax=Polaribacter porphyrae TaxID=1137780 RepID=A0A2S7WJW7_9FLAO|nr:hypothetical protein [Polaribacter porphyrae]PQJ77894.1 hypothetical protein BTO18_01260 [Polaribacter porphyrae]
MKKLLFTFFIISSISCFSQLKVTGYFGKEIGLSYVFNDKFQTEFRVSDDINSEFNSEFSLLYKVISKKDYNLNFGIGVSTFPFNSKNIDFFESVYLPLQLEVVPLKEVKSLAFVLESAYHFSNIINGSGIRNSVGIRYIFN